MLAAFLTVAAVFGIALLGYRMPADYLDPAGSFPFGVLVWRGVVHADPHPLSVEAFRDRLTTAIVFAWLAYAVALALALQKAPSTSDNTIERESRLEDTWFGPRIRRAFPLSMLAAVVALAVLFPPVLSADTAAYVTYGRMQAVYGLNPYITSSDQLRGMGDRFLHSFDWPGHGSAMYWHIPTVYGPIWQLLSAPIAFVTRDSPSWVPMLVFKLVAAASLLAIAWATGSLAEAIALRGGASPGERNPGSRNPGARLAGFSAIALNPLLLIEGPGNGHNDFLCVALVMLALACLARGWSEVPGARAASDRALTGLCLGLAIGVKIFPLALIPWFALHIARRSSHRIRDLAVLLAGALTPLIVGYAFYWHGLGTFGQLHSTYGKTQHSPVLTIAAYGAVTIWFAFRSDLRGMIRLWAVLALWLAFYSMPIPYTWYLTWSLVPILSLQAPGDRRWLIVFCTLAVAGMLHGYAIPPPP